MTFDLEQAAMREWIREAVQESMPQSMLTPEEHAWVKLAIRREAQMIDFRRAVIEKTLAGLIWAGIVGLGIAVREYLISHGMWRS